MKRPKGKAPELEEAKSDEQAAPDSRDIQNADELAEAAGISDFWLARPHEGGNEQ